MAQEKEKTRASAVKAKGLTPGIHLSVLTSNAAGSWYVGTMLTVEEAMKLQDNITRAINESNHLHKKWELEKLYELEEKYKGTKP